MARRKSGVDVHGILLLDKRQGISSNKALQEAKRLFNANKAGHTGALDPLATGLLPVCFGEATKVSGLMLEQDKRYRVAVKLGVMTDTGDAEGHVVKTAPVPRITATELESSLRSFLGDSEQVPPMYSALKQNGVKLYELARQGKVVERKPRAITIYELNLMAFDGGEMVLEVFCSKGTYIRSLAEDIGALLGSCATVTALRRLQVGQFRLADAKTLECLAELDGSALMDGLLPVDLPLKALPAVELSESEAKSIQYGQSIPHLQSYQGMVRLYHSTAFLGLGEMLRNGKIAPKKLFNLNNVLPSIKSG